jgi:hypothetical protein
MNPEKEISAACSSMEPLRLGAPDKVLDFHE